MAKNRPTTPDIYSALLSGDWDLFNALMMLWLHAQVAPTTGLKPSTNIDQLVTDVLSKIWEYWDAACQDGRGCPWPSEPALKNWARSVMRNGHTDEFRGPAYTRRKTLAGMEVADTSQGENAPLQRLIDGECAEQLDAAIDQLNDNLVEVVRKRFLEGMTFKETATKLRLPLSTVYARCGVGLKRLRELLESQRGRAGPEGPRGPN